MPASTFDPADITFGRIAQYDDRSLAYALDREHYAAAAVTPQPRTWRWDTPPPAPLDQGNTSECVTFAWAHELIAAPVLTAGVTGRNADTWYRECKRVDGLGGGDGTSVLAGARVLKQHGYISSYRWAMTEYDLAVGVSQVAPAVIGVDWRQGLMRPDRDGFIRYTGASLGGHCTLLVGLDAEEGFYWLLNSWGPDWGLGGLAKVTRVDMARMLRSQGEACIPTQVVPAGGTTVPTAPTPPTPATPHRPRHRRPSHSGDDVSGR